MKDLPTPKVCDVQGIGGSEEEIALIQDFGLYRIELIYASPSLRGPGNRSKLESKKFARITGARGE